MSKPDLTTVEGVLAWVRENDTDAGWMVRLEDTAATIARAMRIAAVVDSTLKEASPPGTISALSDVLTAADAND